MKLSLLLAILLAGVLLAWSLISWNLEFLIYAITTVVLVALVYWGDRNVGFKNWTIWTFDIWLISHILGGLWVINGEALYSLMLFPIVGEPYSILKYDQVVHAFCYFMMTLLLWQVLAKFAGVGASAKAMMFFAVLAAIGVGGVNEIIEFTATILVEGVNVGGYENNAIDLICNSIGAIFALFFVKKLAN